MGMGYEMLEAVAALYRAATWAEWSNSDRVRAGGVGGATGRYPAAGPTL